MIKKVTGRFATKFAISSQVVSLHVKVVSQQYGKNKKKQTCWFVTFIARHRTSQDETKGYVRELMERASLQVDMKQNSVVYLRCDDVRLWSLRGLEETAAGAAEQNKKWGGGGAESIFSASSSLPQ